MYFQVYVDTRMEWRWRLRAANHEIIAVSSEGYNRKATCLRSIELVQLTSLNTPIYDA